MIIFLTEIKNAVQNITNTQQKIANSYEQELVSKDSELDRLNGVLETTKQKNIMLRSTHEADKILVQNLQSELQNLKNKHVF